MPKPDNESNLQVGVHTVEALIKSSASNINHIIFQKDHNNQQLFKLQKSADKLRIKVHQLPLQKLNYYYKGNHQGVIAFLNGRPLDDWTHIKKSLLDSIKDKQSPYVVLAAGIEDPRNFGACIRSSLGLGCDAFIFPIKGSCGLTTSAAKASSGASAHLPICQINDVIKEINDLKEMGFTVVGLDGSSKNELKKIKPTGPLVIVIGGEDRGIPPHISRLCDKLYQIPINPRAHSYNASVALSIMLYEINRSNDFQKIDPLK